MTGHRTLAARLAYLGTTGNERIKKQKYRSLQAALRNDYNSRVIQTPYNAAISGLINENNQKSDYDYKWLSISFDSYLKPGDVFEVLDDHTHWMVYLPDLLETAYLRTQIVRCLYTIEIDDEEYWVYFQGPTETDTSWYLKQNTNYNELNLSGTIYIQNTPTTKEYFKRFTKFEIEGHRWEVQVSDSITVPGIIELEIQEYFDPVVEQLPKIIKKDDQTTIIGRTRVEQDEVVGYEIDPKCYNPECKWKILDNPRVKIKDVYDDGRKCAVRIYPGAIRTYTLQYGEYTLKAYINIAEPVIKGPNAVFPYDIHTYWVKDQTGTFSIDSDLAKIISFDESSCQVEVITGKSGQFEISFEDAETDEKSKLSVTIGSL